jgi:predicted metalloprotease with PDZ domain
MIHIFILSIKIPAPKPQQKKQNKSIVKVKIKQEKKQEDHGGDDKDVEIFVIKEIEKMLEEMQKLAKEEAALKSIMRKCDKHYLGIGVTHSSLFGEITNVAPGGPADKAGIRVGDIPLDSLNIRDKYPEGTVITIPILRDGITHNIPVTIGKICTESINENKKP